MHCTYVLHLQDTYYYHFTGVAPLSLHGMDTVRQLLEESLDCLDDHELFMVSLDTIGKLRFCCDMVAEYLHALYIDKKNLHEQRDSLQQLIEVAKKVCQHLSSHDMIR